MTGQGSNGQHSASANRRGFPQTTDPSNSPKLIPESVIPAKAGIQYATGMKQPCVYILASRKNGTLKVDPDFKTAV
jgi:hypothetical protein